MVLMCILKMLAAISDEVFKYLNRFARVPVCGAISAYNNEKDDIGPRIQGTLIKIKH